MSAARRRAGTHLEQIHDGLEKSEQAMRKQADLLDLTHDSIFVRDMNHAITYWNRGAQALHGWTPDEALGNVSHELMNTVFPEPLRDIEVKLFQTGRWEGELAHTTRDGTQIVVASRWSLERDGNGRPLAVLETDNDITQRKTVEAQHRQLTERLREAEKMEALGRFAGGIAHDFNHVLGLILGYGEMLNERVPEESSQKRYVTNVLTAAARGQALVDQILAYSRREAGDRDPTDLGRTAADALDLVRGSMPTHVTLDWHVPRTPLMVVANPTQLHRVVINLCSNAKDAMGAGGTLRVSLTSTDESEARVLSHGSLKAGCYACLNVEDSGCGMDDAALASIFEPFFTTKKFGLGTGLGLSIVHGIVTDLSGAIDVKSAVGRGSVFAVYLPLLEDGRKRS